MLDGGADVLGMLAQLEPKRWRTRARENSTLGATNTSTGGGGGPEAGFGFLARDVERAFARAPALARDLVRTGSNGKSCTRATLHEWC